MLAVITTAALCGGSVDSRAIALKTKLSFLKPGQGRVHISASIFRATNQPAILNRRTYVKWKEILLMPAQRFGERQLEIDLGVSHNCLASLCC